MTHHSLIGPAPVIERRHLVACLSAAGREAVLSTAAQLSEGLTVTPLQPAEAGLALMQWRDAVQHQPFFLGEVPMARAAVALVDHRGERAEGGAVVMADDAELAQALALLDAVFAHRWPGADAVDALAARGAQAREALRTVRQAGLQRTRVDFALLAEADEDEEGAA
ncbi:phosphonate C-P lyase system protein PhnG [Methylibium petroleiphilum]|uniref:Phosphonate metabolism protein n=1 Tax=Methylibium petroleiphilum (strain ATCC BAA-1232 / LMG 22953 / PM1) TaxID=420662 RepID=A2SNR0_METPP|nr:phosphonate C-P lyase system protein PhnG [Methylibium petroleiphilum]ABM97199.1 phosphonate metabolism protein [Methylibium petroleiphilum PM1]ABM97233.1 phosphonate metabolism protein [Methylibium petroleiphilum PM1]